MKKLLPLAFLGLAACLQPPVPGFEFTENVQSIDDSLPGGVTFVQNIPFISVARVNDEPLTRADRALAYAALRQYCAAKGAAFLGNGIDLALGLPTFQDGAWLIAGECVVVQAPPVVAVAEAVPEA